MFRTLRLAVAILILLFFIQACSLTGNTVEETPIPVIATEAPPVTVAPSEPPTEPPTIPTETETPTIVPSATPIVHLMVPLSIVPGIPQVIHDQESIRNASNKEAYGGDEYYTGRYERPFYQDMTYIPFIDIKQANLFTDKDNDFVYTIIRLIDDPALQPDAQYGFGIELDVDLDGRGDLLVWSLRPLSQEWSVEGVSVLKDANADIGGQKPMLNEAPAGGDGYEITIFDAGVGSDPDLAWSRISPEDPTFIEIAFKKSLLEDPPLFMWGAWSILGPYRFDLFDHHDHFTYEEAGSPLKSETGFYPLKNLYALDNTCRAASGFAPKGGEPGICPITIAPVIDDGEEIPPNCTRICVRQCVTHVGCCEWETICR